MERIIVIQSGFGETGLAVLEGDKLVEFHTEKLYQEKMLGNIYLGKVANILPGMQAAFVDIGLGKNALLHSEDIVLEQLGISLGGKGRKPALQDVLKEGQEILVQITKEGSGTKGPRVTTRISLPGRFVVLMPNHDHIFISRRIVDEEERTRVKEMAMQYKKPDNGVIIRTVAQEAKPEELEADFNSMEELWARIQKKRKTVKAPTLLHQDLDLVPALLRDLLSTEVDRILVNNLQLKELVANVVEALAPHLKKRVVLQEGNLFDLFKVPIQLNQAFQKRVWLKCGGYLVIDTTEALTAIDINTGRFVGSTNLADTAFKVNMEAATEIARQLRLRSMGGMIVVDFIPMLNDEQWEAVLSELENQVRRDPIKTQVLGVTRLGLVEISRKKTRKSLAGLWMRSCPYCQGRGKLIGLQAMVGQVKEQLFAVTARVSAPTVLVNLNSQVAILVIAGTLAMLEQQTGKKIIISGRDSTHREAVEWEPLYTTDGLAEKYLPLEKGQIINWQLQPVNNDDFTGLVGDLAGYQIEIPLKKEELKELKGKENYYFEVRSVSFGNVLARLLPEDSSSK